MASHNTNTNTNTNNNSSSRGGEASGGAPTMSSTSSASSPASSSSSSSQQQIPEGEHVALENLRIEDSEEELEEEEDDDQGGLDLGPIIPLKQQIELDQEDESLRRWKEQLLGNLHLDASAVEKEPQVKVLTLGIAAEGRPEITISLPLNKNGGKSHTFTLKEGCCYRLCFTFSVTHNIVSGLTYVNTVWKKGIRVDRTRTMLGTYGPQAEPYTYFTDEEITPSGLLARGSYSARTKFLDDDKRCYLDLDYTFEIRKDWTR